MKRLINRALSVIMTAVLSLSLSACDLSDVNPFRGNDSRPAQTSVAEVTTQSNVSGSSEITVSTTESVAESETTSVSVTDAPAETTTIAETTAATTTVTSVAETKPFDLSLVPEYIGLAYVAINNNKPYFSASDMTTTSYEYYSPLDDFGRCGVTMSCIGRDLMPTEDRGEIGMIKPSGWHTIRYQGIDGNYLFNRCHLIGYQLTGENANVSNLITGTRYLNIEGMLPIENMVANYIRSTGNHVLYRSTPIFEGNDLLCRGVLMEGYSVEDNGAGICYCYFAYNVQPGITIRYSDGESSGPEYVGTTIDHSKKTKTETTVIKDEPAEGVGSGVNYILNTNTHKFHIPDCSSVKDMAEHNKQKFNGTRDEAISMGYAPCKRCNP